MKCPRHQVSPYPHAPYCHTGHEYESPHAVFLMIRKTWNNADARHLCDSTCIYMAEYIVWQNTYIHVYTSTHADARHLCDSTYVYMYICTHGRIHSMAEYIYTCVYIHSRGCSSSLRQHDIVSIKTLYPHR